MSTKRPQPDLVIRLVGPDLRPWAVPLRTLTSTLQAVQALIEPAANDDEEAEEAETRPSGNRAGAGQLYLLDVVSKSAAYPVGARDRDRTLRALRDTGEAINDPEGDKWTPEMLRPVEALSKVAGALGCEIEFRLPESGGSLGDVIATIGPETYQRISEAAFVTGESTVYARIERVGGATKERCGIRVSEQQRMVFCSIASQDLARELGRYLYEFVSLSGKATWLRRNWVLQTMEIQSISPPREGSLISALDKIHKAGGRAWDSIKDPADYLAGLRG